MRINKIIKSFTPLEKATDFSLVKKNSFSNGVNLQLSTIKKDAGVIFPLTQTAKKRNSLTGFTLVEILIAVSILTALILAAFQLMDVGRSSWFTNNISVELRQDIIKAFASMEKELKETRPSLVSLGAGDTSTILTFKIPQDIDGNGTILNSSGIIEWSDNILYARNSSGQIIRTTPTATTILANNVTALQFTRPVSPLNLLQIDMTVQKTSASGQQLQDTGQIIIKMRN
ncbi:MAG: prepilin-type N-terminal cleavage/methylation domain-containing protein [Candidatus Omnitrophota bacterium]